MYLSKEEIEFGKLRQGDILQKIHILGALNLGGINYSSNYKGELIAWSFGAPPKYQHVMVLSHSCEIDPENSIKMTSIILAPVRDLNTASPDESIEELKESNIVDEEKGFSYLKYFFLEPHDSLPFSEGAIVDFSKIFSLRNKSYEILVSNKVLQLNEEIAQQMSLKLGLYFHRD